MSESPKAEAKKPAPLPTITLDKDKAYSTVHPPVGGAHFEQGGLYFSHLGKHVIDPFVETTDSGEKNTIEFLSEAGKVKLKRHVALAATRAKIKEIERQALIDNDLDPDAPLEELADNDRSEKFDFVGWLQAKIKVQWFVVAKAIKDEFGYNAQNKEQAIAFLAIEQNLLDPDLVKI